MTPIFESNNATYLSKNLHGNEKKGEHDNFRSSLVNASVSIDACVGVVSCALQNPTLKIQLDS